MVSCRLKINFWVFNIDIILLCCMQPLTLESGDVFATSRLLLEPARKGKLKHTGTKYNCVVNLKHLLLQLNCFHLRPTGRRACHDYHHAPATTACAGELMYGVAVSRSWYVPSAALLSICACSETERTENRNLFVPRKPKNSCLPAHTQLTKKKAKEDLQRSQNNRESRSSLSVPWFVSTKRAKNRQRQINCEY